MEKMVSKIRIVTDTGSDILVSEAEELGLELVSICANFGEEKFCCNTPECFEGFYNRLRTSEELPVSSQPSPESFLKIFKNKKDDEAIIVITISSQLSGTYNGARLAASMAEKENIFVVDSLHASLSQRLVVLYAVKLRDEGVCATEIVERLEDIKNRTHLTGVPADLIYLKKGGRVSPVIASVGDVLGIKPVLYIKDGIIECKSKVRGCKAAKLGMQAFLEEAMLDSSLPVLFAHSDNPEKGENFMVETVEKYGLQGSYLNSVGPAIGTHIGPDALLMAWIEK